MPCPRAWVINLLASGRAAAVKSRLLANRANNVARSATGMTKLNIFDEPDGRNRVAASYRDARRHPPMAGKSESGKIRSKIVDYAGAQT